MEFQHTRTGRPSKRADMGAHSVAISFRIDPALKNLLLDIADGYGISMTELLHLMLLKESGYKDLDEYKAAVRDAIEVLAS